jgi:hypothetical protein
MLSARIRADTNMVQIYAKNRSNRTHRSKCVAPLTRSDVWICADAMLSSEYDAQLAPGAKDSAVRFSRATA